MKYGQINISESDYRIASGTWLTSHLLREYMQCPYQYKRIISGLVPQTDSESMATGRALHMLTLLGRAAFDAEYTVSDGPVNEKTGKPYGKQTKAHQEWSEQQIKNIISVDDFIEIQMMHESIVKHSHVRLNDYSIREKVFRANLFDLDCQAKIDACNLSGVVDIKTTYSLDKFAEQITEYGYDIQLMFYALVLNKLDCKPSELKLIAIENREPYRCGVFMMSDQTRVKAFERINDAIIKLKKSQKDNNWPTNYENVIAF